jgi:hypothetical protein
MSVSAFCIKLVQNIFLSDEDLLGYTGNESIKACMSSVKWSLNCPISIQIQTT